MSVGQQWTPVKLDSHVGQGWGKHNAIDLLGTFLWKTADLELEVLSGEPEAGRGWLQSSIATAEEGGGQAPEVGLIRHRHIGVQQRPDRLVIRVHHLKQCIVALWRACYSDVISCMPRLHDQIDMSLALLGPCVCMHLDVSKHASAIQHCCESCEQNVAEEWYSLINWYNSTGHALSIAHAPMEGSADALQNTG